MFVMESWPEPGRPGARICSSSSSRIVTDIATPFVDAVVWERRVPDNWTEAVQAIADPLSAFALTGPLDQVILHLRDRIFETGCPAFLREDIEQVAALTGALGMSSAIRLCWHPVGDQPPDIETSPGKLRALCCYGQGHVTWRCGTDPGSDRPAELAPYTILFSKPREHVVTDIQFTAPQGRCFALCVDAF